MTVEHLLEVAAGLDSSVLGDAEIIHQIKKAHQFSVANNMQGSLLERAMQAVFKSHKRISNETHFRDGTTSLAYKALKIIKNSDEKTLQENKSILFVGAGDIVKQLFKYNARFNFNNIYISNRTRENAEQLANEYQCKIYEWDKVLANDLQQFDVIISAVSNCKNLIKILPSDKSKVLLIDLSIEGCIDRTLAQKKHIVFYDLDTISEDLKGAREKRFAAIDQVNEIISQELSLYSEWVREAPLRELLLDLKINISNRVKSKLETQDEEKIRAVTNQVMRKLIHRHHTLLEPYSKINEIISEQVKLFVETDN
jgi:glutamyl-tRNA reductase